MYFPFSNFIYSCPSTITFLPRLKVIDIKLNDKKMENHSGNKQKVKMSDRQSQMILESLAKAIENVIFFCFHFNLRAPE